MKQRSLLTILNKMESLFQLRPFFKSIERRITDSLLSKRTSILLLTHLRNFNKTLICNLQKPNNSFYSKRSFIQLMKCIIDQPKNMNSSQHKSVKIISIT